VDGPLNQMTVYLRSANWQHSWTLTRQRSPKHTTKSGALSASIQQQRYMCQAAAPAAATGAAGLPVSVHGP
jgi:hypothetical protein